MASDLLHLTPLRALRDLRGSSCRGFTLLEVTVTITISTMIVLAGVATVRSVTTARAAGAAWMAMKARASSARMHEKGRMGRVSTVHHWLAARTWQGRGPAARARIE